MTRGFIERKEQFPMHVLTESDRQVWDTLLVRAAEFPKRRAIKHLYKSENGENTDITINAILTDSYIRPHKYEGSDISDKITGVKGTFTTVIFDNEGEIIEKNDGYPGKVIQIPPNTWHTVVSDTPFVIFKEKEGEHGSEINKKFASWSPKEGSDKADLYLRRIKGKVFKEQREKIIEERRKEIEERKKVIDKDKSLSLK